MCTTTPTVERQLVTAARAVLTSRRYRAKVRRRVMVRRKTKRHAKWITRLVWRKRVVTDNIAAVYRNVTVPVRSCRPSNRGEDYTLDWNAMEPVLIREAPHATRVYGEASPMGVQLLEDGLAAHPVGVQVVAFHCYDTSIPGSGLTAVPALSRLVSGYGLPLWCSEMTPAIHPHFAGHRDRRAIQRESFMGAVGVAQRPDDRQLRLAELLRHAPPPA